MSTPCALGERDLISAEHRGEMRRQLSRQLDSLTTRDGDDFAGNVGGAGA